jgi:hypothetical protein
MRLRKWVNAFSESIDGRPVRAVPASVLKAVAAPGNAARSTGLNAPLMTRRFWTMTEEYTESIAVLRGPGTPEQNVEKTVIGFLKTSALAIRPVNLVYSDH